MEAFQHYEKWVWNNGSLKSLYVDNIPFRRPVAPLNDSYSGICNPAGTLLIEEWKISVQDRIFQASSNKWYFQAETLSLTRSQGLSFYPEPGTTCHCVLYLLQPDSTGMNGQCGRILFTLRTPSQNEAVILIYGVDDQPPDSEDYKDRIWNL